MRKTIEIHRSLGIPQGDSMPGFYIRKGMLWFNPQNGHHSYMLGLASEWTEDTVPKEKTWREAIKECLGNAVALAVYTTVFAVVFRHVAGL